MSELPSSRQLKWQCRRGLLELDVLFAEFIDDGHYDLLDDSLKQDFIRLLQHMDPDLQRWILYSQPPADPSLNKIIQIVLNSRM